MRKFFVVVATAIMATAVASDPSTAQVAKSTADTQFEVLNPWAEIDPIPARGISPRLQNLAGKKIGLFVNYKRASRPMAASVERRLKGMFPDIQTSLFDSRDPNVTESETGNKEKFAAWAKGVDAVILMVGD
jgi:hypothetical protein